MADPLSITLATLGLVDIACRSIRELGDLVSSIRNAPSEQKWLNEKLEDWRELSDNLKTLLKRYESRTLPAPVGAVLDSVQIALTHFKEDLKKLKAEIGVSVERKRAVDRFWQKAKPVLKRKEIDILVNRLEKDQAILLNLLGILGRHSEIAFTESLEDTNGRLYCVQEGLRTQSTYLEGRLNCMTDSVLKLKEDIQVGLSRLELTVAAAGHVANTTIYGSSVNGATTLNTLYPLLGTVLRNAQQVGGLVISSAEAIWLESEVKKLLRDVWLAGTRDLEMRPSSDWEKVSPSSKDARLQDKSLSNAVEQHHPPDRISWNGKFIPSTGNPRNAAPIFETIELSLPSGRLLVIRKSETINDRPSPRSIAISTFRLVYLPTSLHGLSGIVASFISSFGIPISVPPSLTVFGIHPNYAPIFKILQNKDYTQVRKLLSDRSISPNDKDEAGCSLLCYALNHFDLHGCKLLLDSGADPLDCNKFGESALIYFLKNLPIISSMNKLALADSLTGIRLLLERCGVDQYGVVNYIQDRSIESRSISILNCVLVPDLQSKIGILEPMKLLLEEGCDVNEPNPGGSTPLHRVLRALHDEELVPATMALLKAKADPLSIEQGSGDSCLHKLLTRISACNRYDMTDTEANSLMELIVDLLKRGCDPNALNIGNRTPSEYALSPTAWPLWCQALRRAGYDVASILKLDDSRKTIFQMRLYDVGTETKIIQVDSNEARILPGYSGKLGVDKLQAFPACFICNHRSGAFQRRKAPFDYFGTYQLGPATCESHEFRFFHEDKTACMNHSSNNSCTNIEHREDYHRKPMKEELSWRKQMAYQLWQSGVLDTPFKAEMWARTDE